jgi:AraC family transcriptional regulator
LQKSRCRGFHVDEASKQAEINMSSKLASLEFQQSPTPLSSIACRTVREDSFRLLLSSDPPGVIEVPGLRNTRVSIHVGPSVHISCRSGGYRHRGRAVHGDIYIIPAGTPSLWEVKETDTFFMVSISPELLNLVAEEFNFDPGRIEIRNRFQVRDPQLENIGWALKAEMECGYPCGRLYLDSLAVAVAVRLVCCHSSVSREPKKLNGRLSDRRLRQALDYIEDHLGQNITLGDIAAVVGLSVSHFKILFRESVGLPAHQYVIHRRVERAKSLLGEGKLSISQIAFETGFAHQSHLARHMRRVLGVSPKALRAMLR